jgi:cellulose synthase operon protein C
VVQGYLLAEDLPGARAYLDAMRAERPDDPSLRMIDASLLTVAGETAEAEAAFRALLADRPEWAAPYFDLYGLLRREGREDEAAAVLEAGIAATGGDPRLMFAEAGRREQAGDFEGAIAIFEDLYARDTSSVIVANNLASLLATYRPGEEDLERAFAIARRLRGTEVPQFQDTYGWILARRGDYEEALRYLEPAAAALPDEPVVQYHLGVVQARLGRTAAARERLERAVALAGEDSALPQVEAAQRLLDELGPAEGAAPAPETRLEIGN